MHEDFMADICHCILGMPMLSAVVSNWHGLML